MFVHLSWDNPSRTHRAKMLPRAGCCAAGALILLLSRRQNVLISGKGERAKANRVNKEGVCLLIQRGGGGWGLRRIYNRGISATKEYFNGFMGFGGAELELMIISRSSELRKHQNAYRERASGYSVFSC